MKNGMKVAIRMLLAVACAVSAFTHAGNSNSQQDASRAEQQVRAAPWERHACEQLVEGEIFARTELLFGLSRVGGPDITENEFQAFIDAKVTPRFPEGLTLLSGRGQFKDSLGNIVQEDARLLILLYPFSKGRNLMVDEIRNDYKQEFQQESVLRVDEYSCVSF